MIENWFTWFIFNQLEIVTEEAYLENLNPPKHLDLALIMCYGMT